MGQSQSPSTDMSLESNNLHIPLNFLAHSTYPRDSKIDTNSSPSLYQICHNLHIDLSQTSKQYRPNRPQAPENSHPSPQLQTLSLCKRKIAQEEISKFSKRLRKTSYNPEAMFIDPKIVTLIPQSRLEFFILAKRDRISPTPDGNISVRIGKNKNNESTSFAIYNMYYVSFRIQE